MNETTVRRNASRHAGVRRTGFTQGREFDILDPVLVTTAVHPNTIAGKTPKLSPFAPASPDDLDKQHDLGQFLTLVSDTAPAGAKRLHGAPHLIRPAATFSPERRRNLPIRCGEGDMASLFEIPQSEVRLLDAGAGAGALSPALVGRLCRDPRKPERIGAARCILRACCSNASAAGAGRWEG